MMRWLVVLFFLVAVRPALGQDVVEKAPAVDGAAAKQAFQELRKDWFDLIVDLQKKTRAHEASGGKVGVEAAEEIQMLQRDMEQLVDQIVAAGQDIYRAGISDDPLVNKTLTAIAGFYVTGDQDGDGGDQYEKALPLIRAMIDAGLDRQTPQLSVWGGVSAYCTNQFDLAEKYLRTAETARLLASAGDRTTQFAAGSLRALPETRAAWDKEQKIRTAEAEADDLPRVKLQTSRGDVVIELFENDAPQAVANFITLVKKGYYDGVVFHRVLPQFMAQGGDNNRGGPGYTIRCECYQPGYRKHFRGSLSMAKPSNPPRDSGGSQFFLTFVRTIHLDGKHTVFGRVIEGMEAAAALKRRNPQGPPPHPTPDKIIKAEVLRDRGHAYEFEKLPGR